MTLRSRVVLASAIASSFFVPGIRAEAEPHWETTADAAFALARREHRFVILDLQAVWCHWCHVMDTRTYGNSAVQAKLAEHYVALKLDQDANPDFAARYGDWGWPATIVFSPEGGEIVKRRGYIEPAQMIAMLDAIVADPSPGPSVVEPPVVVGARESTLGDDRRKGLLDDYRAFYDAEHGGWGDGQRYVDANALELAMELGESGDRRADALARKTLDENLALIDPVWGGVYQYSIGPAWNKPHFEKIMSFQADDLRLYALAYATWKDPKYRDAANAIMRYMTTFLRSPEGAFYVSQDADLSGEVDGHAYYALAEEGRRRLGLPHVDKHVYARENGWATTALCQAYDSLGEPEALHDAERAMDWILAHRALPGGGFRHEEHDVAGPYLADNIAVAQGLLALYRSSADSRWLAAAERTLNFIDRTFRASDAGFVTAPQANGALGVLSRPVRIEDENTALARTAAMASHITGSPAFRRLAEHAARYVTSPTLTPPGRFLPGVLLVDRELGLDPLHIAIVGSKSDAQAQRLHTAALGVPAVYRRVDWWDRSEGPLPNAEVTYPSLGRAAAFICTGRSCSTPVFDDSKVAVAAHRLSGEPEDTL